VNKSINTLNAPKAVGAYPHAKRVGNLLFLSGIGPRLATDNSIPGNIYNTAGELIGYDIVAQCHSVFANVKAVLNASELGLQDLVDVTVYLTDMTNDFTTYNKIWAEYFPDADNAPCRTTLGITALPTPIAIELKCIAALKDKSACC
jgi:2-aminomuconate deaminase